MAPTETELRERLVRLETEMKHMVTSVDAMSRKVEEMHELLQQAKGAKYIIVASAALAGFVSAKLAPLLPWVSGK